MSRSTAEAAEVAQARAAQTGGLFDCGGDARDAAVVVIGVPWEPTVSYRRGASQTPGRIARASQQVDLHSELLGRSFGAETALTLREDWLRLNDHACAAAARGDCAAVNAASAQLNAELAADCAALHASGRAAGVLGGDHSAAYGAIAASAAAHGGRGTHGAPDGIGPVRCEMQCARHHLYKRIWSPCVGEQFETFCEEDNKHDKYAMAVHLKNSLTVVGHILREITRTCHFFIKNKGEITGEVSGRRQYCTAACGGLEVPCLLTFYHRDTP